MLYIANNLQLRAIISTLGIFNVTIIVSFTASCKQVFDKRVVKTFAVLLLVQFKY